MADLEQISTHEDAPVPEGVEQHEQAMVELAESVSAVEREDGNPSWLPEKFESPEDMAKAYHELEKKLSSNSESVTSNDEGTQPPQTPSSDQQEQINELIVSRGKKQHVVRLKGGDPFIFGRGAEEMEYAAKHGISVAMVPGISSSVAVPASQNIPVTKRGAAESFWVITGTTKDHKLSKDVALAAKSSATVVILMGMSKLSAIVALFQEEGKSETPIAIIQNGTRKDEKIGIGTISTIEEEVRKQQLSNPAIIIIGEVVNHRATLSNAIETYKQAGKVLV